MILLAPFRIFWDFWTRPIRAESLALFRILLGLTILASILTGIGQSLSLTCGPDNVCPAESCDDWLPRTGRPCLLRGPVSLPLLSDWLPAGLAKKYPRLNNRLTPAQTSAWAAWGAKPSSAYLLFGLLVAALACVTLGCGTRIATLVSLVLLATFHHRLSSLTNGGDTLSRNALYFLLLSPAGAAWSLDRFVWRKIRGRSDDEPVMIAPWSVRLMQIQVCMVYLFTGMVKLGDGFDPRVIPTEGLGAFFEAWSKNDWLSGQAIYWVLNDISLTRWPYALLPLPLFVCRLLSWGTIAFEIGFSFFICIRPLRKYVLLGGLLLHLGILATMEIGWFSQVTMCWYALWIPGERIIAFAQSAAHWFRGRRAESPAPAAA